MSAVGGMVGGLVDTFAGGGDKERQQQDEALKSAQGRWKYNTDVAGQSGTEFDKMSGTGRDAMTAALGDYENRASQGGLDAIGRATVSQGVAEGEQAARASSNQILNQAKREGRAQGPAAMIQAQVAGQQGAERARSSGMEAAALAEQGRERALQGQERTAGAVYGMDANRAAAQDAINRFNVMNAQQNVANKATQGAGGTKADMGAADVYGQRAEAAAHKYSNLGSAVGGGIASMVPGIGQAVEGVTQGVKAIKGAFSGGGGGGSSDEDNNYGVGFGG